MFQTKVVGKNQNTFYVQYGFFNRAIYEIIWKNIVEPGMSQCDACSLHAGYIPTNPHSAHGFHSNNGCRKAPKCYDMFMFCAFIFVNLTHRSIAHSNRVR
jgi:hypothetical protein